jgi:hypothetical protein
VEMVDEGKKVIDTNAGKALVDEMVAQRKTFFRKLQEVREAINEAVASSGSRLGGQA